MNILTVEKGIFRGPAPKNFEEQVEVISQGEVAAWLHLENGYHRLLGWRFAAHDWQARLDRTYKYMPMSNFRFPTKASLEWCAQQIEWWSASGGIYVSCLHGVDRTGIVIAYWRVKYNGLSPNSAWQEAQVRGMHKFYLWLGWEKKFKEMFVQK